MTISKLAKKDYCHIAKLLPDNVDNVLQLYAVNKQLCDIWASGNIHKPQAFIIKRFDAYQEPKAYGDSTAIVNLLNKIDNWTCVLIANNMAKQIGKLFKSKTSVNKIKYYDDINYQLTFLSKLQNLNPLVRLLSENDHKLFTQAPPDMQNGVFTDIKNMLKHGISAGIIINQKLVAIAYTTAITDKYADITIFTLPEYRKQGFATSCAYQVCKQLLKDNIAPVWSTGVDNYASQAIAQKLGFQKSHLNTYVIVR